MVGEKGETRLVYTSVNQSIRHQKVDKNHQAPSRYRFRYKKRPTGPSLQLLKHSLNVNEPNAFTFLRTKLIKKVDRIHPDNADASAEINNEGKKYICNNLAAINFTYDAHPP